MLCRVPHKRVSDPDMSGSEGSRTTPPVVFCVLFGFTALGFGSTEDARRVAQV